MKIHSQENIPVLSGLTGKILVVDDDPGARGAMRKMLELAGHTTSEAASGEDALGAVKRELPDAILLDVVMVGMSGMDVCRTLKTQPGAAHVPIILVTSLAERRDRIDGIEAGANDFVTKPVDREELLLRVRNAIYTKRLFDDLHERYAQLRREREMRDGLTRLIEADNKTLAVMLGRLGRDGDEVRKEPDDNAAD